MVSFKIRYTHDLQLADDDSEVQTALCFFLVKNIPKYPFSQIAKPTHLPSSTRIEFLYVQLIVFISRGTPEIKSHDKYPISSPGATTSTTDG